MKRLITIILLGFCISFVGIQAEAKVINGFDTERTVTSYTLKSKKKGTLTVRWKKVPEGRYQIQICKSKKFGKSRITVQTFENSYKFKDLKRGKVYYVRIRAFLPDGEGAIFTEWSKVKKIRIKK